MNELFKKEIKKPDLVLREDKSNKFQDLIFFFQTTDRVKSAETEKLPTANTETLYMYCP